MKNKKIYIVSTFVIIEVAFLFAILFSPKFSNELCWFSVLTAFLFSLFWIKNQKFAWITICALLFTVASDFCLEMLNPIKQSLAMSFFSIVQILYAIRLFLMLSTKKWKIISVCVRIVACLIAEILVIVVLQDKIDYLSMISLFYYANLIINVIYGFCCLKKEPLLAFGLLFFLLCDTVVGLNVAIGTYISVPADSFIYKLAHTPFNLAWTFYVPAQTLLSLSISKEKN